MSHSPPGVIFDRRVDALGDLRILPDETLCAILELLSPTDLGRLSCVSSVMYILCNEEPIWMNKCLSIGGSLEYKGSWKKTALLRHNLCKGITATCHKPLQFDGFFSFCLYKRWYRCNTSLSSFSFDTGDLERKENLSHDEFSLNYDSKKPIMLMALAETWPARTKWTVEQLVEIYGDTMFRLSQKSSKKIMMKFKDYVSYMQVQHDDDPLYIFDDKFGERAPSLLEDYEVPHLFKDDFFDLLGHDQRPPFRWLIIGPERSGASWHVDPGLTTAWNTLLCGRKRWALYPPGRVPAGVTVHVNEEDGDINIKSPTSLQWWLDIYPHLSDEDKPIECTQFPGETIYVPTGWWHCVLNLETTIAVTQNYVNKSNFEFVCLDLAPGHRHKGVSRVGFLALPVHEIESILNTDRLNNPEMLPKEEIFKSPMEISDGTNHQVFSYDIEFLSQFLEEERNHYSSAWSPNIYIGQREMREWLCKLWVAKPDFRELIWKGACVALNVEKWYNCLLAICSNHKLPTPLDDEKLPVGTGSNPVFVILDNVVKIYVEGGFESALHGLGTELEFYNLLQKHDSPLMEHVPQIVASGFLVLENGSRKTIPWDGRGVPGAISELYPHSTGVISDDSFSFGVLQKMQSALKGFNMSCTSIWPYLVTKRCNGDIFAKIREKMSQEDALNLASFLGVQLRALHQLPLPLKNKTGVYINHNKRLRESDTEECGDKFVENSNIPSEWKLVADSLHSRQRNVKMRLEQWGDPIPAALMEKAEGYLPHDVTHLLDIFKDDHGFSSSSSPSWIHSDIMDDNILVEPASTSSSFDKQAPKDGPVKNGIKSSSNGIGGNQKWIPTHIIDFSDLSIGDPLLDVIPLYLDVLRGDVPLLKKFLESYALPISKVKNQVALTNEQLEGSKLNKISYRAMCYCILHEENVLGAIFSLWDELKAATSWETVEETVWGELNNYQQSLSCQSRGTS